MKRKFKAGTTSVMLPIRVRDSSSTTGAYLGGLVYNTLNLAAKYRRQGDSSWTTITLVNATAGTFTSGGFCAAGSAPTGAYELHVPNAAFASGAQWVEIEVYGAANMVPVSIEIELDVVNYQTARFGASAAGDAMTLVDDAITEAKFADDTAKYQAKIWFLDDTAEDRYAVVWFKNGEPIVAGITSPTIWVYDTSGADLLGTSASPQALTQIGATGTYMHDEGTNRVVDGTLYLARVRATIDGSTRTWYQQLGRDA